MKRRAAVLTTAVVAAGLVHAAAGHALAAVDPITALLGHGGTGVVVAAIAVIAARLFLTFVAPGWAAWFVATCVARAVSTWRGSSRPASTADRSW